MVFLNVLKILFITFANAGRCLCDFSINNRQEVQTIEPDKIEVVTGIFGINERNPNTNILPMPVTANNPYLMFHYPEPAWRASASLVPDLPDSDVKGTIQFHQWNPNNFVRITVNATGIPAGKHAIHIHFYGDVSQGCKSTGPHFQSHFIGNIEAKEDGEISLSFFSAFLNLFGYHGIIGRSVVIHEKPIESHTYPPDVFSSPIMAANTASFQTEENSVGTAIACGVISVTENIMQ